MNANLLRMLLVLMLVCTLLTGCWNRRELQELVFVTTIGIDWNEETESFDLTVEMVRPLFVPRPGQRTGGGPEERPYYFNFVSGRTASEALLALQRTRSRNLSLIHLQAVVFGEEAARRSVADMVDYLWRFHQTRPFVDIIVAEGSARDLLGSFPGQGDLTGRWLAMLIEQGRNHGYTYFSPLHRVMYEMVTPGISPVVPVFTPRESGTPNPENVPSFPEFKADRLAIFREERMVSLLTPEESRGLLIARGDARATMVTAPSPGAEGEFFSAAIRRIRSQIQVDRTFVNSLPTTRLHVRAEAEFYQRQRLPQPVSSAMLGRMEQSVSQQIKDEVEAALAASRAARSDAVGFGEALRRANPALWHQVETDWNDRYPDLSVTVTVEVNLTHTGLMR